MGPPYMGSPGGFPNLRALYLNRPQNPPKAVVFGRYEDYNNQTLTNYLGTHHVGSESSPRVY